MSDTNNIHELNPPSDLGDARPERTVSVHVSEADLDRGKALSDREKLRRGVHNTTPRHDWRRISGFIVLGLLVLGVIVLAVALYINSVDMRIASVEKVNTDQATALGNANTAIASAATKTELNAVDADQKATATKLSGVVGGTIWTPGKEAGTWVKGEIKPEDSTFGKLNKEQADLTAAMAKLNETVYGNKDGRHSWSDGLLVKVDENAEKAAALEHKVRYNHDVKYQEGILKSVETRLERLYKLPRNRYGVKETIEKLERTQDDLRSKLGLVPVVRDEPSTEDVPADDATEPTEEQAQPAPTDTVDTPPTEPLPVPVADPAPAPAPTEPLLR